MAEVPICLGYTAQKHSNQKYAHDDGHYFNEAQDFLEEVGMGFCCQNGGLSWCLKRDSLLPMRY